MDEGVGGVVAHPGKMGPDACEPDLSPGDGSKEAGEACRAAQEAAAGAHCPEDVNTAESLALIGLETRHVHRFVARQMANPADAADLAQQTLLVACERLGTFRNGNLRAWLFSIARHLIVD